MTLFLKDVNNETQASGSFRIYIWLYRETVKHKTVREDFYAVF